jgi:hypothetical protein
MIKLLKPQENLVHFNRKVKGRRSDKLSHIPPLTALQPDKG